MSKTMFALRLMSWRSMCYTYVPKVQFKWREFHDIHSTPVIDFLVYVMMDKPLAL